MAYYGLKGQECPVCKSKRITTQFSKTCSRDCGLSLRALEGEAPAVRTTLETRDFKGPDLQEITLPRTRIQTLEQLIQHFKIDTLIWEVERFVCNKWEMGSVPRSTRTDAKDKWVRPSAKPVIEQLFQVKATFRRKRAIVAARAEIDALKELAKAKRFIMTPGVVQTSVHGYMLEINIPDLHVGKLAWATETGHENYDVKLAEQVYWEALDALLTRTCGYSFEQILLVCGNDLLNSDDLEGQTTKGTRVTTDVRFHKTFGRVRTMMIQTIERLRQIAPVKVLMVPGNHDQLSVWHLGDSLECFFHGIEGIEIDNTPVPRKYRQFGRVMLMFTHGDKGKRQDYPLLMATEEPTMFGQTMFREAHTGHTHQTKMDEQHGVRVRVLPALCSADDWHAEQGFVGNLRSAEAFVWSRDEGLVGTAIFTKPCPRPGQGQVA